MAGIKNYIQERNWHLPDADNSSKIEDRHALLHQHMFVAATYCHFCGEVMGIPRDESPNAQARADKEKSLGAHFHCLQKNDKQ